MKQSTLGKYFRFETSMFVLIITKYAFDGPSTCETISGYVILPSLVTS